MKEISRSIYALVLKDEWVPPLTTIERKIKLHRHMEFLTGYAPVDCCAPSMQPPQRMHIASVMKQCSGYELAVIVMNPLQALPLTSHHNNKDV